MLDPTFANGLLMGKIMAFSPVNIPTRLNVDDHYQNYTGVTEDINKAIKATARTITKSKLSDKIHSEVLLQQSLSGRQKLSWIHWVNVSSGKRPVYSAQGPP